MKVKEGCDTMFELINGYEKQRAHREMIRREVARHQLADALRTTPDDQPRYAAVLAGMGDVLVEIGLRLQHRYGVLVEETTPAREAY
jgi:hypothetical protein